MFFMMDNLKLKNFKGIKDLYLRDLMSINIICGKNNSGKSSILEAISNDKHCASGIPVNKEILNKTILTVLNTVFSGGTQAQDSIKKIHDAIKKFVESYSLEKTLWYTLDKISITKDFESNHRNDGFLQRWKPESFKYGNIVNSYFTQFKIDFSPLLIPPKRQLVTSQQLNNREGLDPRGHGVINRLFFLKNQDNNSTDHKTYLKIVSAFKGITNTSFNVTIDINNQLNLSFLIDNKWLPADNCGLGLCDILTIVTVILSTQNNFILIEEPENHLHADFQKKLLNFINKIQDKQFFLSTHSNVFLDINNVDKIYYCWFDGEIKISDQTSPSKIINSLGYSVTENLTSDAIILTEGPKDIPVIQAILKWVGVLDKYNIKLWPLGGDIMGELDLSIFSGRENVFAIIDDDPGSKRIRNTFSENCKLHNIHCYALERYAIENYFTIEAIRKVFGEQIDHTIILKNNKSVDDQIGFKAKNKSIKAKNFSIMDQMNLTDFENTDLLNFIFELKNKLDTHFSTTTPI
jgi:AAA15 family ATPase/GTPase